MGVRRIGSEAWAAGRTVRSVASGALALTLLPVGLSAAGGALPAAAVGVAVTQEAARSADASALRSPSPVADAAMRGDEAAVRALLDEGADPDAPRGDGMTALHWAAERGDAGMAALLLEAGAAVDATTRLGAYTPLALAARAGRAATVGLLLEAGADPDAATTTGGIRPLHFAAAAGSAEPIRLLLARGAEVDAREDHRGQTPLMFAASADRVEAVHALLEGGADPALVSDVVEIPAVQAADAVARRRREQMLDSMAEAAGLERARFRPTPVQVQAAVRAANAVRPDVEPVDLEAEAVDREEAQPQPLSYAELVGRQGGFTALLHATREGHRDVAVALLDGGADIDRASAGDRTSPMLMALLNGHFDLALDLLERGADPHRASDAGTTPLYAALNTHWAPKARYPQPQAYRQQEASYLDVMKALLEAGADPNVRLEKHLWTMGYTFDVLDVDTRGATPFWRAAYATDVEAMELLVAYGADPDIATEKPPSRGRGGRDDGELDPSGLPPVPPGGPAVYPIHAASGVGYGEGYAANAHRHVPDGWLPAVRYLVENHGADVNARDLNGYTPLHHAAARGDNELILYLVEKGADVTAVSRRGQTTADMANGPVQRISPFPETVALLESLGSENNHRCMSCQ